MCFHEIMYTVSAHNEFSSRIFGDDLKTNISTTISEFYCDFLVVFLITLKETCRENRKRVG